MAIGLIVMWFCVMCGLYTKHILTKEKYRDAYKCTRCGYIRKYKVR